MINRLRGTLVEKDTEGVVLDVGGVGYRASASVATLRALPSLGEECVIHTRLVVREDAMLLFGFAGPEERMAFDALTAVSKVGPKLALSMLSTMSPAEVSEAVAQGRRHEARLGAGSRPQDGGAARARAQGQGPGGVRAGPVVSGDGGGGPYMEAREALTGLGYTLEEAEQALNDVPPQDTVEKYIKEALRRIGGRR